MVLSYNHSVFGKFLKTQLETWDSEDYPNIDVCYYTGGNEYDSTIISGQSGILYVPSSDDYNMMHWKFRQALMGANIGQYDFILRTNSCSYIRKDKLVEIASTLPKEQCYAGWDNGGYVSGAGIFFSPDTLDIVKQELTEDEHYAEDVLIGKILSKHNIEIQDHKLRHDVGLTVEELPDTYHYRFKTSIIHDERVRDINNMKKAHDIISKW